MAVINLTIDREADFSTIINLGQTYDASQYVVYADLQGVYGGDQLPFDVEFNDIGEDSNGNILFNQVTLSLDSVTTTDLFPGRYTYDAFLVEWIDSNTRGPAIKLQTGIIDVQDSVTYIPPTRYD